MGLLFLQNLKNVVQSSIMGYFKIVAPSDKSISHRAVMFNGLASGKAVVHDLLLSLDTLATLECFQKLGCRVELDGTTCTIYGCDWSGNVSTIDRHKWDSDVVLDCKNSGTTMRLMSGILASKVGIKATLIGDTSLSARPMNRVIKPLLERGANITSNNGLAPLNIVGSKLDAYTLDMPIASAQLKSAILLSGLDASGSTTVFEPRVCRNHTEIMLKAMGADITVQSYNLENNSIIQNLYAGLNNSSSYKIIMKPSVLKSTDMRVPGDISSAAFWMVLGAIKPDTTVCVTNVGINPTRDGILKVFDKAGVNYRLLNIKNDVEMVADIEVSYTKDLKPFVIDETLVPLLIDEIPILALLACYCDGTTTIKDASELRVKECDRIKAIVNSLKALGADITETIDGFVINSSNLRGGVSVDSYHDHRIAMMLEIANVVVCDIETSHKECIAVSYPEFEAHLKKFCEENK